MKHCLSCLIYCLILLSISTCDRNLELVIWMLNKKKNPKSGKRREILTKMKNEKFVESDVYQNDNFLTAWSLKILALRHCHFSIPCQRQYNQLEERKAHPGNTWTHLARQGRVTWIVLFHNSRHFILLVTFSTYLLFYPQSKRYHPLLSR